MGIEFMLLKDAPEGVRHSVPNTTRYVGIACLTDTNSDQYLLYRGIAKAVTGGTPLTENEFSGEVLGFEGDDKEKSYYIVAGQ